MNLIHFIRQRLTHNSLLLTGSILGGALINFAISIRVGRWLGESEFGRWVFLLAWASVLTMFCEFGLHGYLTREAAKFPAQLNQLLLTSLSIKLEPVCKIRKQKNRSNCDHGREIGSSFFIACGNAAKLLETINEPLDNVSFSIERFFKGTSSTLIASTSNRTANMFLMKIRAKVLAGIAFICHQAIGTQSPLT